MTPEQQRIKIEISSQIHERFWSKSEVHSALRCWNWIGGKDKNGYGQFQLNGMTLKAPRVAFWLRNGIWPDNACHTCDNPSCVNPDHLFNGTHSDNMRDMVAKGRHKSDYGESHAGAVLTDKSVLEMRELYKLGGVSLKKLADKYGCSYSTARRVITRENWTHL